MAEVTRVPLQPIAKGSLTKLWVAIVLAVAAAAGIAWAAAPQGIDLDVIQAGSGPTATADDVVFVKYVGRLADGTVFDESQPLPIPEGFLPDGTPFPVEGGTIEGFSQGLAQMQKGGKYLLEIPARLAYGDVSPPGSEIPAGSDLEFEIEVVEIMSRADAEQRFALLQQMMQAQQAEQGAGGPGGSGGPGGPPMGPPAGPPPGPPPGS